MSRDPDDIYVKPCPWCGSTEIDPTFAAGIKNGDKPFYAAGCWNCSACGPDKDTPDEALNAWNTRKEQLDEKIEGE